MFVTPNRKTHVYFDVPDNAVTSEAWCIRRRGGEICQRHADGQVDDTLVQNCKLWPTGAWSLRPLQTEISSITEYEIGLSLITAPDNPTLLETLVTAGTLAIENNYRYNDDLPGLPASAGRLPSGGPFIVKRITAGNTWDMTVPSGQTGLVDNTTQVTPIDRVGESVDTYPENQAWFLSWSPSGDDLAYPNYVFAFYFGGFGVLFTGSGQANLYEYVQYNFDGHFDWVKRGEWKYARTGQVSNTAHSMAIWPHVGPHGEQYIAFTNGQVDFAQVSSSASRTTATSSTPGDYVYTVKSDPRYAGHPSGTVTQAAPFRFDIRRDLKMKLQVSTLGWPSSGYLIDDPAALPAQNSMLPVNASADTVTPPGTSITPSLYDAETGDVYDSTIHTKPVARFDFASDGSGTPILWAYSLNREALIDTSFPGTFTGGNLRSVNIAGYSGDPTQETGTLVIDDVRGELLPFLNRGQFSVLVTIDHEENGQMFTTPVFRGYVNRPEAERKVKPGKTFPSVFRHKYTIPLMGQWLRLVEAVNYSQLLTGVLYNDQAATAASGGSLNIPYKATDAIVYLLEAAGCTPNQINVPDLPLRLWSGTQDKVDEFQIDPTTDFAELAQRIARNFLGLYLCHDLPTDTWTLLQGTPLDAIPLYNFYTEGGDFVPSVPNAYGPQSTFITTFNSYIVPPEFNAVHVITGGPQTNVHSPQVIERWLFNYASFAVPGGLRPDPNNPDYVGRMRITTWVDPSLTCTTDAETQGAVDWTARRIYDLCCHAQRIAHFEAPLVFVLDPLTNQYRMPRFLDPITINGQNYQVKCCAPHYTFDGKQMASYEAIQPIATPYGEAHYVPPGIESLSFYRAATGRHSQKEAGSSTSSTRFGLYGTPPHAEHRFRDLPRNIAYQRPLQDPQTGQFYFMAGYDSFGAILF